MIYVYEFELIRPRMATGDGDVAFKLTKKLLIFHWNKFISHFSFICLLISVIWSELAYQCMSIEQLLY